MDQWTTALPSARQALLFQGVLNLEAPAILAAGDHLPSSSSSPPIGPLVSPSTRTTSGPPEAPRHHAGDSIYGQLTALLPPTELKAGLPGSVAEPPQARLARAAPTAPTTPATLAAVDLHTYLD